ncbi:structural maintenance of chromosomes protein 4-like [Nicotiana sylvestris]|uniref:structural maintenance of chromosomes protein 4-like n=1 Tax=Nicotiana sylvestris TaxID=4096 RepID=UPI00388CDFEE
MDGSDRHVVAPGNYNLLMNSEQVVSALDSLCAAPESKMLGAMSDVELSQKVTGMALQTLVLKVERERRERKKMDLYEKMSSKYQQYSAKHRVMSDIYHQDPEFQVFRERIKQREDQLESNIEELKERDEELVKAVARNSELEASLKLKVADLTAELSVKVTDIEGLKGELNVDADKLAATICDSVSLEDALRISRSELTGEREASGRQVAGLKGRVKELEVELATLKGQMASLRAEETSRRSQPSMSRALADPGVPRHLYELWVHAEARLDRYKAFHSEGRATEVEVQAVHAKARAVCESCGYNPLTPDGEGINFDDTNHLALDSWYKDTYPTGDDV